MRWIIFLLIVSFAAMGAMDFEALLEQHKKEVLSTFIPQESKLIAFVNFLKNSDLKKEKNQSILKAFVYELQMTANLYNSHSEIGGHGREDTKFDLLLLRIQPFIQEEKNE